jgi:pyruvate dehydrogenase E1 component alpha subunit
MIGALSAEELAELNRTIEPEKVLKIYRTMVLTRAFDSKVLSLQRQGKIGAYITSSGEEACAVGSAFALREHDWMFTSYREHGAHLVRGMTLDQMFAQIYGNSSDLLKGRQMSNSWGNKALNIVPTAAPIGAYLPVAVGCAMALKMKKENAAVLTFLGDGGTSSSDFHTAMNFAGVYKAPVVFVCRNNGWAISLPVAKQTASETLAVKAQAYGFAGITIDGNDALLVFSEAGKALEKARSGGGPTFIETLTYRLGAHSTADDPARYRDKDELDIWKSRDPVIRLKNSLILSEQLTEEDDSKLRRECERAVADANRRQESVGHLPPGELIFEDVFADVPEFLKRQREELERES